MNNFLIKISFLLFCISIIGCKSVKVNKSNESFKLKFLDEYILPENVLVDSTIVGGLSGIDYYNGLYYLVCDDAFNPRFYKAKIELNSTEISNITIENVIKIKETSRYLDLEAIRYDSIVNRIFITSEGHIKKEKQPSFISVDEIGEIKDNFKLPDAFNPNSTQKPRHNGTLEGLSKNYNGNGYWIAMELPFEIDGPEPQLEKTNSPVRVTYINSKTKEAEKQFGYLLDPIAKTPKGNFSVNGLSEILEYDKDKFFIIERSYSSGLGNQGNTIKIFKVDASKATNTLNMKSLMDVNYNAATKTLLLDFENLRDKLTSNSIDNIEGITFGPTLPNGNRSLVLVADNNFNRMEKQLNQFILLEIID